jgi:phenylalanyl-tRNA synthetase beta chain
MDQVTEALKWLDFKPEVSGDEIICHIPSYRTDIERPADIDEEVIRLIGFDSLKSTLPYMAATVGRLTPVQNTRRRIREIMRAYGLNEIVTYTLVSQDYIDNAFHPAGEAIALAMPMSDARKYIRSSLINSVLECVQYNEAHQNSDNTFFEISKVYGKEKEEERLAVAFDGVLQQDPLHKTIEKGDFYAMKGLIMNLLSRLGFNENRIQFAENTIDTDKFHPYRSAAVSLDKNLIGVFGEIHPAYAKKFDLKRVVYGEFFLDPIFAAKAARLRFAAIDRYPAVERDIALVVDRDVTAQALLSTIRRVSSKLVRKTDVFDVYEGEHIEAGKKSVALRITYQAPDHTLKEEEITSVHERILALLKEKLHAELRG